MSHPLSGPLAKLAQLISGASIRLPDEPLPERAIYYANHTSHLDFIVLWSALPPAVRNRTRPVAAQEYWEASRLRNYVAVRIFNALLLDRSGEHLHNLREQLQTMTDVLDSGGSLIIFPEGTRGDGSTMREFQAGLHALLRRCPDAVAVPVKLGNLNRVLPKGEFLPVPQLSTITFGAPIRIDDGEKKEAFLARARQAIIDMETA